MDLSRCMGTWVSMSTCVYFAVILAAYRLAFVLKLFL